MFVLCAWLFGGIGGLEVEVSQRFVYLTPTNTSKVSNENQPGLTDGEAICDSISMRPAFHGKRLTFGGIRVESALRVMKLIAKGATINQLLLIDSIVINSKPTLMAYRFRKSEVVLAVIASVSSEFEIGTLLT